MKLLDCLDRQARRFYASRACWYFIAGLACFDAWVFWNILNTP